MKKVVVLMVVLFGLFSPVTYAAVSYLRFFNEMMVNKTSVFVEVCRFAKPSTRTGESQYLASVPQELRTLCEDYYSSEK